MHTELKRNVSWLRCQRPIIHADGVFAHTITMNPWAIVEGDTVYLFYAGDDATGRRQIRLATAPVSDPANFTFRGIAIGNGEDGSFDYAWSVLPHVVKLKDGLYFMIYSGNCGHGHGLSQFPGLGAAWSTDLLHWEKYEHNPVVPPQPEINGEPQIGIAGGGLIKEDLPDGSYLLHLYYTGMPTLSYDNIFLDQQKATYHATSTDGIHWENHTCVRRRSTALDYENIASTGGPVIRDSDGLYRNWYSAIGTRWGVYSMGYAESEDGIHWARGVRYGENLVFGPESRDIDELHFRQDRWQDQSVSYPSVIRLGDQLRLYYCGNEYGVGGIGTAVSAPLRLALTGEAGGKAKIWDHVHTALYPVSLSACACTAQTGELTGGVYQEGFTYNANVFYEQFPVSAKGEAPLSVRAIAVSHEDGVHIQLFLYNRGEQDLDDVTVRLEGFGEALQVAFSDIPCTQQDGAATVSFGTLKKQHTTCCHGLISLRP